MANNRVFYAIEQLAIKDNSASPTNLAVTFNSEEYATGSMASGIDKVQGKWEIPRGMQSVGMSTTFNLEEVFELGQVEVYEQSERQADVEFTLSKIIEGSKPLWFMLTDPSVNNNLVGRTSSYQSDVILTIYADTQFRADNDPISACVGSGMYLSNVTYNFSQDGAVTEEVTLISNDKIWTSFDATISGQDDKILEVQAGDDNAHPGLEWEAPVGVPSGVFGWDNEGGSQEVAGGTATAGTKVVGSGVQRREEVDIRRSILPADIPGVVSFTSSSVFAGTVGGVTDGDGNDTIVQLIGNANTDYVVEHIQSISCTADLARSDIFELGSKRAFLRYVDFPVEVTCSVEVNTSNGDLVDARSEDATDNTVANNTIIIRTIDGMQVDLGDSNRLVSTDLGGGDAGGDNMTCTYNYRSFNTFNVSHDRFNPNHRIIVFQTGSSRFNQGFPGLSQSDYGL
jgi:hypothetical protein